MDGSHSRTRRVLISTVVLLVSTDWNNPTVSFVIRSIFFQRILQWFFYTHTEPSKCRQAVSVRSSKLPQLFEKIPLLKRLIRLRDSK